jgi:hypothetical protein
MKNVSKMLQKQVLRLSLGAVLILLVAYLFCPKFRIYLSIYNIDPNFIIGFFTILALLLSLIQGSKDKRYSYNLRLIDSIEDKGLKVIGKLLGIKSKSSVVLSSAIHCVNAMKQKKVFKDLNGSLSKEDIETDVELITAYIDTYFHEQGGKWNNLIEMLTEVLNIANNILVNYQDNLEVINNINFKNDTLDNADASLEKASSTDKQIEELTLEIRNGVVAKINESKEALKNSFDFSL